MAGKCFTSSVREDGMNDMSGFEENVRKFTQNNLHHTATL